MRFKTFIWIGLILILLTSYAHALTQNEKLWLGLNVEKSFTNNNKWIYLFFAQARFINKSHPWQTTLLEGGVGYLISPANRIWLGYRCSGMNPNNGFNQENRLWQQLVSILQANIERRIVSRTRLEESEYSQNSPVSYRLRQRFSIEIFKHYFGKLNPQLYDEVFFPLNKTNYTSQHFFSQNRLFLGCNYYTSKNTFYEIGYMNQYQFRTPQNIQNQINHIVLVTYNFV